MQRHLQALSTVALTAAVLILGSVPAVADATSTSIVSVSTGGSVGNFQSGTGGGRTIAISDSGRFVAFTSDADNLVLGDTNFHRDVFLRDRDLGTTVRVSVGDQGQQGDGFCEGVAVANDGSYVAYASRSTNLVPNDANGVSDVFLWDAASGTSALVSRTASGAAANGASTWPSIDALGRRVVFQSHASDLVANDTNALRDVFAFERVTGLVELVSVATSGAAGTGQSQAPYLARDGRFVAFATGAQFDPSDPNNLPDVYVRDLQTGTTELVGGVPGGYNGALVEPAVSMGGRYVTFATVASNVVPGAQNNGLSCVYRVDRQSGAIDRVSVSTLGELADSGCFAGDISVDGAWVAFLSDAGNLTPTTTQGVYDIFVRRVDQGWTEQVSVSGSGSPLSQGSWNPAIAGDGRFVAFRTPETGLAVGDTNGTQDVFVRDRGFGTRSAGGTFCLSTVNSTGQIAELSVGGTNRLADQQLILATEFLPPNSLGYYLFSETAGNVLGFGGSQGRLCLGGSIFRLSTFVQSSGANGMVVLPLPFGQLPPGASLQVGDTWNFQYWFRDSVGGQTTSNTSTAVCVPLY